MQVGKCLAGDGDGGGGARPHNSSDNGLHFFILSVPEMKIKIEPGISLDKMKKESSEKLLGDKESEAREGRDELVTPEPTGEEDDAVILDGDAEEEDNSVKQTKSTIQITRVSGGDKEESKTEERKGSEKKEGSRGRAESREETSGLVGELFTQLVGEVEKINEGVERQEADANSQK